METSSHSAVAVEELPEPLTSPVMLAAWYGLAVLVIATVFASVDRQILALVIEPLRKEFGLSDTQIGTLNGIALSLVAMLATLPLGWLADRIDRRVLLAACIMVWSVFTAAIGLAQSFGQLFVCSMGIAVGEAVLGPVSYAFIADLFPKSRWMLANYVYFVTGILGAAAGMIFSGGVIGYVEANHATLPAVLAGLDPWRVALIFVAIPGPVMALMVLFIRRQGRPVARSATNADGLMAYIREHARTFIGVFCGFGLVAAAQGTIGSWVAVVLVREFHESPAETGRRLGLMMGLGSVLGVVASYLLVRWLQPRIGRLTALRVALIGIVVACLCMPAYLFLGSAQQFYVVLTVQTAATVCAMSLSPTVLQFMAPGHMRGRVIAIGGLFYMVLLSLSPIVVGAISDQFHHAPGTLLRSVLLVAAPCYLLGGLFIRYAEGSLLETYAAVDRQ